MLPFFAQGAAQAIEDAVVLARCLQSADRDSVPQALQRYETIRASWIAHCFEIGSATVLVAR